MTSYRAAGVVILLALILNILPGASAQETSDYYIRNYELTVDLQAGSRDVRVTMDITYQINSGSKSEGFKYIGNWPAVDVEGRDPDGEPLRTSVEQHRETMIRWRFPPVGPGEKRVRISFTIPEALSGNLSQNAFRAEWAGIFKVPVTSATYRLVLPDGWSEDDIDASPSSFSLTRYNGRRAIEAVQSPLRHRTFAVTFRPAITQTMAERRSGSVKSYQSRGTAGFGVVLFIFGLFWVIGLLTIATVYANRGANRRSWGSSSCAGGSSCSSGCGGGGCGGGCGG